MILRSRLRLAALALAGAGCLAMEPQQDWRVVGVPVADVRSEPGTLPVAGEHDALEETQVVYGEPVRVLETRQGWARIEAIEQPEFSHHNEWKGYPGWVLEDALRPWSRTMGAPNAIVTSKWATIWKDEPGTEILFQAPAGVKLTLLKREGILLPVRLADGTTGWISRSQLRRLNELKRLPSAYKRQQIVRFAEAYIGDPYFWGGRSPYTPRSPGTVTGVDCSGLTNLVYRMTGVEIPRDAHEQSLRARGVFQPQPADLIFLSDHDKPNWIVHVMLYAGEGWLIEAPGTGEAVRRIRVSDRLGRPIEQLHPGDLVGDQTVFFGAYLSTMRAKAPLADDALTP